MCKNDDCEKNIGKIEISLITIQRTKINKQNKVVTRKLFLMRYNLIIILCIISPQNAFVASFDNRNLDLYIDKIKYRSQQFGMYIMGNALNVKWDT